LASVHLVHGLGLHRLAVNEAILVHDLLQRVVLPAEQVITMSAVSGATELDQRGGQWHENYAALYLRIAKAPLEGLRAICGPVGRVVERSGVKDDLVHQLWDLYGMGSRAGSSRLKGATLRVGDVIHVVGRVEVDSVPAAV
jgi:hypothetical protein